MTEVMVDADLPPKKRRKKGVSPTARTLAECRKRGWDAQVVEQTIPRMFIKRDLFGVIDIVAITPDGILGIQATSGAHHANRLTKIGEEPRAARWIRAGGRLAVWSWTKGGAVRTRKLWTLREELVELADFVSDGEERAE